MNKQTTEVKETVNVKLDADVHYDLKVYAAVNNENIRILTTRIVREFLAKQKKKK